MTAYSALAPEIRLLLAGMVFLSSLGELALCLYRALCTEKWKRCIFPIVIYLCLLGFLSVAIGARVPQEAPLHPIRLPWLCFP
ncbi:MAG: hypothetical protein IJT66_03585, partial [Clostridia bacterium]|nr:hypothetical protein [Clostridia bacterium]